ncbi:MULTISPECIES: DUF2303 family protein [unclassified Cryobacterium]|uniref:DUF2303 family protein n=1 Tax=unclassified Cryobacterium TaxID=2649013 RepID=UPI002AB540A1|nr:MULTISPECIES: DUF2303 family protein [unclassified Cryobacterium]MDY7542638.1 DUF2303 family protein [Cryobacterium sp. 5B3]MEB0264758.1 DUF2303 family protein [Cryobacterium sp. 10I5]MEB0273730.1 DUF2303 family protein [Cryobacterium sp. 5B3]
MSDITEAQAIAELAVQTVVPTELVPGTAYAVPNGDGSVAFKDTDAYGANPRRAKGARVVTDAASFVGYLKRHSTVATEVYADTPGSTVVAVIDSHTGADKPAGWEGHKLTLGLVKTPAWLAWAEHDLGTNPRAWFNQAEFAEFIEARALDVVDPDHARLIEIATTFEAKSNADFGSAVRLDNGEVKFEYTETTTAKAGSKGALEIPKILKLAIRPYIGGPIYHVTAQFRYRVNSGDLRLGFALERPQDILDAAFADVVSEIRDGKTEKKVGPPPTETRLFEGITAPIFYGKPQ